MGLRLRDEKIEIGPFRAGSGAPRAAPFYFKRLPK
jgi:hypothetical protein